MSTKRTRTTLSPSDTGPTPHLSAKATDKAGYGNPPKEHQFKKGVSGNPSGKRKPKPSPDGSPEHATLSAAIIRELERTYSVTEDGRQVRRKALELVAKAVVTSAIQKDGYSRRILLTEMGLSLTSIGEELPEAVRDARSLQELLRMVLDPSTTEDDWLRVEGETEREKKRREKTSGQCLN